MRNWIRWLVGGVRISLAAATLFAAEPRVAVNGRYVTDAVETLGLSTTTSIGNAAKLSAAMLDRSIKYPFSFPGGTFYFDDTILWPARTGIRLEGAGHSRHLNDNSYFGPTMYGGQPTRFIWVGAANHPTRTMLRYDGTMGLIDGIHFQGHTMPGPSPFAAPIQAAGGNPTKITLAYPHWLSDGVDITIAGAQGNTAINGQWKITKLSNTQFSIPVASNGLYVKDSGNWRRSPARVGIHVRTYQDVGASSGTGKLRIQNTSFQNVGVGILLGSSMDRAYEQAERYTGLDYNHADLMTMDNVNFFYDFDHKPTEERTCIYSRNDQSSGNTIGKMFVSGCPNEDLYIERGTRWFVQQIAHNGRYGCILRLGKVGAGYGYFDIGFDVDAVGGEVDLLRMDAHNEACKVVLHGDYSPPGFANVGKVKPPLVTARGSCEVTLRDVQWVPQLGIKMIGLERANLYDRVCRVHLDSCALAVKKWPSELIDPASSGPYILTWSNCSIYFNDNSASGQQNLPVEDGYIASPGVDFIRKPKPQASLDDPHWRRVFGLAAVDDVRLTPRSSIATRLEIEK